MDSTSVAGVIGLSSSGGVRVHRIRYEDLQAPIIVRGNVLGSERTRAMDGRSRGSARIRAVAYSLT